jgi:hypothetical protein
MITVPRIFSVMETRCLRIGTRLRDDTLNGYELVDLETSLRLIHGVLARYLRDAVDRYGGSQTLCSARANHNHMHDRLELIARYRDELLIGELRGFLYEVQGYAMEALLALGKVMESEPVSVPSGQHAAPVPNPPSAQYTASELRMGIGRTRK